MKNKKDLKEVGKKIEEAMETLEKNLDKKVLPKIKGMEMPILVAMVAMILAGLSMKMLIMGVLVLAILLSPMYMDKIMSMLESKEKKKTSSKPSKSTKKEKPEVEQDVSNANQSSEGDKKE
jgi:hypothetical protein